MENRRVLSYALFLLAIVVLLALGLGVGEWLVGILGGMVFIIAGVIFYRRGK